MRASTSSYQVSLGRPSNESCRCGRECTQSVLKWPRFLTVPFFPEGVIYQMASAFSGPGMGGESNFLSCSQSEILWARTVPIDLLYLATHQCTPISP